MKLQLEEWSHLSQILAALVVIASLAYVALEIEQNTKAVQAASYQAIVSNLTAVDLAVVTNPELDRIITKGESSPDELTLEEWSTFSRYSLTRIGQLEMAYLSFIEGGLNVTQWSGIEVYMPALLCMPGYSRFWDENYESVYAPAFVEYVKSNITTKCN